MEFELCTVFDEPVHMSSSIVMHYRGRTVKLAECTMAELSQEDP